jgi:hypothetical protein
LLMVHAKISFDAVARLGRELDHICCCRLDIALCGAQVGGTGVALGKPSSSLRMCSKCADLDAAGKRCAEPDCPGPSM